LQSVVMGTGHCVEDFETFGQILLSDPRR